MMSHQQNSLHRLDLPLSVTLQSKQIINNFERRFGKKDKSINHTVKIKSQLHIFYVILFISKATTVFFFFFALSEKKTICKNRVVLEKLSFSSLLWFQRWFMFYC